jgi:hypothetical protein
MSWIVISEGNCVGPFDTKQEAEDEKARIRRVLHEYLPHNYNKLEVSVRELVPSIATRKV